MGVGQFDEMPFVGVEGNDGMLLEQMMMSRRIPVHVLVVETGKGEGDSLVIHTLQPDSWRDFRPGGKILVTNRRVKIQDSGNHKLLRNCIGRTGDWIAQRMN